MNDVLSRVRAARTSTDPQSELSSAPMLSALVDLHEDMIEQLRLERLATVGNAALLTDLIDQHETSAALLREKLQHHPAESADKPPTPTMSTKSKSRPAIQVATAASKPLRLHDVTNRAPGPANIASHRRILATQTASGRTEHARHHASPRAQG